MAHFSIVSYIRSDDVAATSRSPFLYETPPFKQLLDVSQSLSDSRPFRPSIFPGIGGCGLDELPCVE